MFRALQPFLIAFGLTALLTPLAIVLGKRLGIVDIPGGRRIHQRVTPRTGGIAIMLSFFLVFWTQLSYLEPNFKPKQLLGFAVASLFLLVIGIVDDKFDLPAWVQLASHVVSATILVLVGMGIEEISNPFGGKWDLHVWDIAVPIGGVPHHLALPADLLTIVWVVLVINSLKWLNGLDGLAEGVSIIGLITIALLSVSATVDQPHVAVFAMTLAGAISGFLLYNFHPAKIFLGTPGSTFIGFTIATLAIISGGKIATALLVLGVPILDALTLIVRRFLRRSKAWAPGTDHLHHLLMAKGFGIRRTVVTVYALSAVFGGLALLGGTTGKKALAFVILIVFMGAALAWLSTPRKVDSEQSDAAREMLPK